MSTTIAHPSPAVHTPAGGDSAAWLRALHAETKKLRTAQPALGDRLSSALHLASTGAVSQDAEGRWQVESRTTPGVFWQVEGACECPDAEHHAPEGLCAHRLAVGLHKRALKAVEVSGAVHEIESLATALESAHLPVPRTATLPEAMFSLTIEGKVGGNKVLLTARGQSWDEFEANVARVRTLLDAPGAVPPAVPTSTPAAAPASPAHAPVSPAPQAETPPHCPVHGPMRQSPKVPGTWFCPKKLFDGSYCQSRHP